MKIMEKESMPCDKSLLLDFLVECRKKIFFFRSWSAQVWCLRFGSISVIDYVMAENLMQCPSLWVAVLKLCKNLGCAY